MFKFFFQVNRKKIITFCGVEVIVEFDINGPDGKLCFRNFEDGKYSKCDSIKTKHPNIVKSVIIGKKGWGLWRKEWSEGISEGLFRKQEILDEFKSIEIPNSFLKELDDFVYKNINKLWNGYKT